MISEIRAAYRAVSCICYRAWVQLLNYTINDNFIWAHRQSNGIGDALRVDKTWIVFIECAQCYDKVYGSIFIITLYTRSGYIVL